MCPRAWPAPRGGPPARAPRPPPARPGARAGPRGGGPALAAHPPAAGGPARAAGPAGETDLAFTAPTPRQTRRPSGAAVAALTSYTTIGGAWHATFSQTNLLAAGTRRLPRGVRLELGAGRMSDDLRSLRPGRPIQLDVVTEGQLALHMPVPTSVATR